MWGQSSITLDSYYIYLGFYASLYNSECMMVCLYHVQCHVHYPKISIHSQNVAFGDYARPAGGTPPPLASLANPPPPLASLAHLPPPLAPLAIPTFTTARPLLEIRSRTVASNSLRWPWTLDLRSRPQTASEVRLRSLPRTTSEVAASNGLKWVLEV